MKLGTVLVPAEGTYTISNVDKDYLDDLRRKGYKIIFLDMEKEIKYFEEAMKNETDSQKD